MKLFGKPVSYPVVFAAILLAVMASLMLVEAASFTTIVDESPHLVAGYSYVVHQDYRLNPEHPPLIKAFAALPLAFQDINFPDDSTSWTEDINGQWRLGDQFLHESGNNPVSMMFWGRLGPIVITLLLGGIIFVWTRKLYGNIAALFATTLFSFSPTFLAHGPLITTDVGAAFAFLFATFFLFRWLQKQNRKNLILAGVAFGIAQLMKFSLILLVPYFAAVVILWVLFKDRPLHLWSWHTVKRAGVYLGKLILIGLIGLLVVWPVYQYAVMDYPVERQVRDTTTTLESSPYPTLAEGVEWMADKPVLRPYAQFFLGHLMVFQRVSGGNTVYFLGEVSSTAWAQYFPVVFLFKTPLAFILLIALAVTAVLVGKKRKELIAWRMARGTKEKARKVLRLYSEWMSKYIVEISLLLFVVFYWTTSIMSNLNIGIRHVLPTFPFIYIVLAGILHRWIHSVEVPRGQNPIETIKTFFSSLFRQWIKVLVIGILILWYVVSPLTVFPHMLAYFNEAADGPENGHNIVVDSNLDWGQDLRGLARYVEENNIETIKVDYFGGGNPAYYLGDKYKRFDARDTEQREGWIAVSATLLQNGRGVAAKGFDQDTTYYTWLDDEKYLVDRIGYSIFVYHLPAK